ncbi:MAG: hypothetical protein ABW175_22800 [Bradyrhizobium sp.]
MTKPFLSVAKSCGNKALIASHAAKLRGLIMFIAILNLIYREFLKRALMGMTMQGGKS